MTTFTATNSNDAGTRYQFEIKGEVFAFWDMKNGGFRGMIHKPATKTAMREGSKRHAEVSAMIREFLSAK